MSTTKPAARTETRCRIDSKQPGIIRFNDAADSFDGILAGTRAKEIVQCVNSHAALIGACRKAMTCASLPDSVRDLIKQALAQAGKEAA